MLHPYSLHSVLQLDQTSTICMQIIQISFNHVLEDDSNQQYPVRPTQFINLYELLFLVIQKVNALCIIQVMIPLKI